MALILGPFVQQLSLLWPHRALLPPAVLMLCGLAFRPSQLRRAAPQESSVLLPLSETLEVLLRRKGELGACPAVIASPPQTRLFQREERLRAVTGPGRAG